MLEFSVSLTMNFRFQLRQNRGLFKKNHHFRIAFRNVSRKAIEQVNIIQLISRNGCFLIAFPSKHINFFARILSTQKQLLQWLLQQWAIFHGHESFNIW